MSDPLYPPDYGDLYDVAEGTGAVERVYPSLPSCPGAAAAREADRRYAEAEYHDREAPTPPRCVDPAAVWDYSRRDPRCATAPCPTCLRERREAALRDPRVIAYARELGCSVRLLDDASIATALSKEIDHAAE